MKVLLLLALATVTGVTLARIPPLDTTRQSLDLPLAPARHAHDPPLAPASHAQDTPLALPLKAPNSHSQDPPLASARHAQDPSRSPHPKTLYTWENEKVKQLWDKYSVYDDPPTFVHPNLTNAGDTTVVGRHMYTINNRHINAFMGLRFAEPPLGEQRFKKPLPVMKYWEGDTLMANHMGEKCPQKSMLSDIGCGDEDCLYLNVFTPFLPGEGEQKLLPVMFFLHGGGFIMGDTSLYLPTKLLDRDVILVTAHYRLGALGWFSLDNADAPGNAGLWDQVEAMKWVQNNIEGFGGDPDSVTIFGQSAGSASVSWQLLLPESAGLFHRVIAHSGSALEHWATDPDPLGSAVAVGEYLGCDTTDYDTLYECMLSYDAHELALKFSHFEGEDRSNGQMGFRGAAPVVQGPNVPKEYQIITQPAEDYFTYGNLSDVPLVIGATKHEGSFVLGVMYSSYLVPNGLVDDAEYLRNNALDDLLIAFGTADPTHGISEALHDSFMPEVDLGNFTAAAPGMIDLCSVLFLKAGAWEMAKLHAKHSTAPTFFYSFDFHSDDTMFNWLFMGSNMPFEPGVTHTDDLMYIFSMPAVMDGPGQLQTMNRMVRTWTNFATYGDPTPEDDTEGGNWGDLGLPRWKPLTHDKDGYVPNYNLIQQEWTNELEYPNRWHIAYEESMPEDPTYPTWEEYNSLEDQKQAYMISMIAFVVCTICLAAFLAYKTCMKK